MKAQPSAWQTPAPGQAFLDWWLDTLFGHWTWRVDWPAVGAWLDRSLTRLGEAEIGLSGCYELLRGEEPDPTELQDGEPHDG